MKSKSKNILIIAAAAVVVLTAVLFVIVFSMQNARAEQAAALEEAAEEVAAEATTEEPAEAEVPDKAAEAEELPEEIPDDAELSVGTEEETEASVEVTEPAEEAVFEGKLAIGCFTQSEKKLKESEVVESNWKSKEPSAADITEEQAIEIAKHAGKEIFGLKDLEVKAAKFQKDMTGQRGSYWAIQFKEDELYMSIDALSGNIAHAYSDIRRSDDTKHENLGQAGFSKKMNEITTAEDSAEGGEYTAATKAIAEKYISGKIKEYQLNAVHGDGKHYPLVSIDVMMEDGVIYEFEWSREKESGELKICCMDAFPSWDHFRAWSGWDADVILCGDELA